MPQAPLTIDNKQLYKMLFTIALPILLQTLITSSLNLVDNLMIGSLGELELASVGLANQLYFVQQMLIFGFVSGASTYMAQFWGDKNLASVRKVTGFAITVTVFLVSISTLIAFFFPHLILRIFSNDPNVIALGSDYLRIVSLTFVLVAISFTLEAALRITEQTKIPLVISIIAFSTNTFLNFILIFGNFGAPALGVKGAAIATLIARIIELVLLIFVIFVRKNLLAGPLKDFFSFGKILSAKVAKNALPTTINEVMWSLGMASYNAVYGRLGVTAFAAVQASNTINSLFITAAISLGDAILIIIGKKIGEGEMEYAYLKAVKLVKISIFVGLISGLLLIISSFQLIKLYNFTPTGQYYSQMILIIYGVFMWFKVYNGVNIVGTLRAGGDTKFAMMAEIISVWGIGVPIVFFCGIVLGLPVHIVLLLAQTEEVIKAIILYKRFRSKKWLNYLIKDVK